MDFPLQWMVCPSQKDAVCAFIFKGFFATSVMQPRSSLQGYSQDHFQSDWRCSTAYDRLRTLCLDPLLFRVDVPYVSRRSYSAWMFPMPRSAYILFGRSLGPVPRTFRFDVPYAPLR